MKKVLIFGSTGLVGSSVNRILSESEKFDVVPATRKDANLFSFEETNLFINKVQPDFIVNSAARVGGILANNEFRTEFILENLKININILESLIQKPNINLINLGSSCIYPLNAENPISEESLMQGTLEPTNSPYAMAKLTAIELGDCLTKQFGHNIVNLMPTNLYGPNDNFSPNESHVIPGLISKLHSAKNNNSKVFEVWGTGKPLREFLYVDDLANAIEHVISNHIPAGLYNVGSGHEISIRELVEKINKIIEFKGEIKYNDSFPDGNPRKLLNSEKIFSTGWKPETNLDLGLKKTYDWFKKNYSSTNSKLA